MVELVMAQGPLSRLVLAVLFLAAGVYLIAVFQYARAAGKPDWYASFIILGAAGCFYDAWWVSR